MDECNTVAFLLSVEKISKPRPEETRPPVAPELPQLHASHARKHFLESSSDPARSDSPQSATIDEGLYVH